MHLWQVSLAGDSRSLIGHLALTFGGAPNFNVVDSLDGAYFGTVQRFRTKNSFVLLWTISYYS